jgi:HD-like signal output (HDOD) protein
MFWNFFKKSTQETHPAIFGKIAISAQIPLAFLKKLIPIGELPTEKLRALPGTLRSFNPGDIIFTRGDQADSLPYLQEGEVFLETGSGSGYTVDASTFKACYPLSTGSEHKFSAFAKTQARVVYLPIDTLRDSRTLVNNPLIKLDDVPAKLRNSAFFKGICAAYRKDDLRVPSLPDVALRLRAALQKEIGISDAVKIVNLDPVISSKLIQVVNSPLYLTLNPAASCHDAINRLGLKTTQNLVTSISLNNLFRSADKQLHEKIQHVWKQSIQIASLSHTLASISRRLNPDEALLAGLIHNIGALPVITFAESFDKNAYSAEELELSIALLQGLLGVSILKKWHFPDNLRQIPLQISNWYYDDNETLQLSDIVLLAKFHSQLGTPEMHTLPPLNTLPAFHKLGDAALTPDMSLQALHDAKQQIAEALNFFRT